MRTLEQAADAVDLARARVAQAVADVRRARAARLADRTEENFNALLRALNAAQAAQFSLSMAIIIARAAARRVAKELRRSA